MKVISDTSPITNLLQIGQLDILPALFDEIVVPESVFEELNRLPEQHATLQHLTWLKVEKVQNRVLVNDLLEKLDVGEAESIVLALEIKADYLLMDERRGRRIAKESGLMVTGLVGLLLLAKSKNLLPVVEPLLDELLRKGFRITPHLYTEALRLAGETK